MYFYALFIETTSNRSKIILKQKLQYYEYKHYRPLNTRIGDLKIESDIRYFES